MIGVGQAFSPSYARARVKFLEAAAAAGASIMTRPHPLIGRDAEVLALDTALQGDPDAENLLIVSSGCHGIEGHCGSGVQVFALHDEEWREKAQAAGVAVLYIHALTPHGFSYGRRVTSDNVDLNRNFQDFSKPLPANPVYRELHGLLLPECWPPDDANQVALADFAATHGIEALQSAITRGQYEVPDGLYFGGKAPTWSNTTLRALLRQQAGGARRIGWIDVHTGLGPAGIGERIFAGLDDAATLARARAWWGDGVTSIYDGTSSSSVLTGMMFGAAYEECPQAEYTGIAIEFGTLPLMEVLNALRGDHWLHLHPNAPPAVAEQIRQRMRAAFYPDTDAWKGQVTSQARQALFQAVDGMAG